MEVVIICFFEINLNEIKIMSLQKTDADLIQQLIVDKILILTESNICPNRIETICIDESINVTDKQSFDTKYKDIEVAGYITYDLYTVNPEYIVCAHTKKLINAINQIKLITNDAHPRHTNRTGECIFYITGKLNDCITSKVHKLTVAKISYEVEK